MQSFFSLVRFLLQPIHHSLADGKVGTTRDSFEDKTVTHLEYESYVPKALRTMLSIAKSIHEKHELTAIAMIHRLGTVPIGEDSIYIAVSSPHRAAAWRAGEEALERTKDDVEVWKKEEFEGEDGVWRANRDGKMGERIDAPEKADEERTNVQQNGGLHAPINDIGPDGERVIRPKSKFERGHGPVVHRQ